MALKKSTHRARTQKEIAAAIKKLTEAAARLEQSAAEKSPSVEAMLDLEAARCLALATESIDTGRRHMLAVMLANGQSERGAARVLGWSTTKARAEREAMNRTAKRVRAQANTPVKGYIEPL